MKIRNGFVSNSSSSSFVIIGKSVEFPKKYRSGIYCIGRDLNDGDDVFKLTKYMHKLVNSKSFLKDKKDFFDKVQFIEGFYHDEYIHEFKFDKSKFPDGYTLYSGECDYNSTKDLEKFIDLYLDDINQYVK